MTDIPSLVYRMAANARDNPTMRAEHLKNLPIDQARVLLLAKHHGMSHSQIAELTGLDEGTVKSQMRQGLLCLREVVTDPTTDQR
jgi:DNA-directed RNA polymerase specialized sigma24 family protein